MSRLRISPLAVIALGLLLMLNFVALGWLARLSEQDAALKVAPAPWSPEFASAAQIDTAGTKRPAAYPKTLARPIFFKDRRPYRPPPPPPPPAPPKPKVVKPAPAPPPPKPVITAPDLTVAGIAITREAKKAFVKPQSGASGSWVGEGEEFMGWRVRGITPGSITLEKAGRSFALQLYEPAAGE